MTFGSFARIALPGLVVAALGVVGAGCPGTGPGTPDSGPQLEDPEDCEGRFQDLDNRGPCKKGRDCAQGSICDKSESSEGEDSDFGCCLKVVCQDDTDCADGERCDVRRGLCISELTCDPANPATVCQGGDACIYQGGDPQCVPVGNLPSVDECEIAPKQVFAHDGEGVEVKAVGKTAAGALVPLANFNFESDVGDVVDGVLTADCAGPDPCTGSVTATAVVGAGSCEADVVVYPAVAPGDVRIVVFDQTNNEPVSGAPVAAKLGDGSLATGTTDATGAYTFAAAGDVDAVSAFPPNHQWQTILGSTSNDLVVFTVPVVQENRVAGVKGQFNFDEVHTQGDIKLGLSGTSISAAVTDLNFTTLIGEIADYPVDIEGVTTGEQIVPLPSGLVIELATEKIKGDYVVFGDPGERIVWALGGKVRLSEVGPIISNVTNADDVNVGSILSAVLPFFATFDHAVVTGVDLVEVNKPAPPGEDQPVPYDAWDFPEREITLDTLLVSSAAYEVPRMPCASGKSAGDGCTDNAFATGAVVLNGVIVPGQGLVPLGLSAALDDPDDQDDSVGTVDGLIEANAGPGDINLDYAPPHDGLEGNLFLTVVLALDIDGIAAGGELGTSILTHVTEVYEGTNTFPASDFLEHDGGEFFPATATFNFSQRVNQPGPNRFWRLNLNGAEDEEWNVWFDDPALAETLDLNTLLPAAQQGQRTESADIQAFQLGSGYDGPSPAGFDDLFEFNGTNLDNLVYYIGAFSSEPCQPASEDVPAPHCLEP